MKRLFFYLFAIVLVFCQCGTGHDSTSDSTYNEFVSAYTGGTVSRTSDIRVVFSQDVPQGRLDSVSPADIIRISPAAEGTCLFADARTLVFKPKGELKRDEQYKATVNVDRLFAGGGSFSFSFRTRPFAIRGKLKTFDVAQDDFYELTYQFQTADAETDQLVEDHVSISLKGDREWTHAIDGMVHQLKLRVKPTGAEDLVVRSVADSKIGSTDAELSSLHLPSATDFSVISAECVQGDRKCIVVTFNQRLDPKRDIRGLVYIEGEDVQPVVEGNKVMLYSERREDRTATVVISHSLRSIHDTSLSSQDKDVRLDVKMSFDKPQVAFVGDGTIVPQSDRILIPFRSIYTRGVRVAVYRIFGNMVGSMLQSEDIDNTDRLCFTGRPVAVTTFYVDDPTLDLSEWHTFAIDLTDQVRLEPGAVYHIDLALDARLSAWPCDTLPRATREEIAAEDAELLASENRDFEDDYYFWSGRAFRKDISWWDYDNREDPSRTIYYCYQTASRNVLATNIGLTAMRGTSDTLCVTAINLPDAQPMSGVSVEAYSRQQQLLGQASTDRRGIASIAIDPHLGQPFYVIARHGDDYSYLRVKSDQTLSTSTFDVSGDKVDRGLKGYIYGERGVWRPGDTLHLGFMLCDRLGTLPEDHPVTLTLTNPLGQVVQRITRNKGAMGLYAFSLPTAADAPTGNWTASIRVGGATFNKNLRVETIKPNRLKIDLDLPKGTLTSGSNEASLHTEWLNGHKAGGLRYDISANITETHTTWKAWKDYVFDDPTKSYDATEQQVASGQVGEEGNASCLVTIKADHTAPGMLRATLTTHVYEPSGEFSLDVVQANVAPYARFVGIKAPVQSGQSHLDTDRDHVFSVASVDAEGKAIGNVSLKVDIYKVDWHWWWSSSRYDMAGYTASRFHEPVKTLSLVTDAEGKGDFKLSMTQANWGTYLIMVNDKAGGHSAGLLSYFDWPWMSSRRQMEGGNQATALTIVTDKEEYAPGEKMHVFIPSGKGSRAIISVSNGSRILHLDTYPCQEELTEVVLDVTEAMTPNVYVAASLVQPYEQTANDMPIRMYGIVPVTVTSARSHLTPVIKSADEWLPETKCQVTVSEKDGRPMSYTLAVVDEGLLDLTRFRTPDAWTSFNAREALGVRFWDLYSHVSGAYGGRIDQLFSIGGDDALLGAPKAVVNRFTPMVHFSGPYTLRKGEKRTHRIDVPNYNGRVRIMVVAGDGRAYGSADKSVLVRRPLMLIGTMPRQIGRGDEMTVAATLFASKALGDVKVTLTASKGLQIVGSAERNISFAQAGDQTIQFRVRENGQKGDGTLRLQATAAGEKAEWTSSITVRTVSQTLSQTVTERVAPGATFSRALTLPGDGSYSLGIDASATQPLRLADRLSYLIAYPHGCAEQLTSRAFPQLCLSEFTALTPEQQKEVENNIKYCINRLGAYQTSDGGMSYWPGERQSHPWASAYVLRFLTEASARGYYVPDDMQRRLRSYVSSKAAAWTSSDDVTTAAYQLYVLATLQKPEYGAMNRMRETGAKLPVRARSLLAAAYALSGRKDIAQTLLKNADGSKTENWWWCSADVARLVAEMALHDTHADATAETVRQRLSSDSWLSTSESALALITMSGYYKQSGVGKGLKFGATLDGKDLANVNTPLYAWTRQQTMSSRQASLKVRNDGDAPLFLTVTSQGVATQSHVDRISSGLDLTLQYTDEANHPVNPADMSQSATFYATLTVRNTSGAVQNNIAVTHVVPAGWEVLKAVPSGAVSYQDVRDDRVLSYINKLRAGESVTIRLNLSATYAGHYYLPSVHAEAMYNAAVSGCTQSGECEVK